MSFQEDLIVGQAKELEAIPLIIGHYKAHGKGKKTPPRAWLNPSESLDGKRRGDIFDNYGIRWEVKYDRRLKETGNFYLEHAALQRSGSDYVIFFFDDLEPLYFSKDGLLSLIDKNQELGSTAKYQIVNVGRPNVGTIVPFEELKKLGQVFLKYEKKKTKSVHSIN